MVIPGDPLVNLEEIHDFWACGPNARSTRPDLVSGKMAVVLCLRRCVFVFVSVAFLQMAALARKVEGTVPLIRGVRSRVYGVFKDSALIVSNGREQQTLTVDRHGHFHAELPEGTWRVIDVSHKDRERVVTGQTFRVTPGTRPIKINIPMRLR